MKILGISGSLRKGSLNTALLREAQGLAPDSVEIEIYIPADLPLFNADLEDNFPEEVLILKKKVKAADAILFATPEHNYNYPAVLKNALEWVSRPYHQGEWIGKPAAIIGASPSNAGTTLAQHNLRKSFVELGILTFPAPQFLLSNAEEKMDAKGRLKDEESREKLKKIIQALIDWSNQLSK